MTIVLLVVDAGLVMPVGSLLCDSLASQQTGDQHLAARGAPFVQIGNVEDRLRNEDDLRR